MQRFNLSRRACHDDPQPLLEPPPPVSDSVLLGSRWTATSHHFRSAQGNSRASRQGAFGWQLSARTERRARGGAAQQHLGDRVRRWSGHQASQRGVPRAGLPGWYNVGTQRKVWRRRGWEHFCGRAKLQQTHFRCTEFYWRQVKRSETYHE